MIIAGYAIGAERGYIYLQGGNLPAAADILERAIGRAYGKDCSETISSEAA